MLKSVTQRFKLYQCIHILTSERQVGVCGVFSVSCAHGISKGTAKDTSLDESRFLLHHMDPFCLLGKVQTGNVGVIV